MSCTVCGRDDVVTDEGETPRCSRHINTGRKFEVEVLVEVELDGDEEAAHHTVDRIMQRAWDADQAVGFQWHFTMLEGCVAEITDGQPYGREEHL